MRMKLLGSLSGRHEASPGVTPPGPVSILLCVLETPRSPMVTKKQVQRAGLSASPYVHSSDEP